MRRRRKGTFLLQTMFVMGAASLLTLLSVSLMHQSFSFCSDYRRAEENNLNLRNLGHKLRQDLLITRNLRLTDPQENSTGGIELRQIDGTVVRYSISPQSILRTRQSEASANEDGRNSYRLAKNWEAKFEATSRGAQLTVLRKLPENDGPTEIVLLRVASDILPATILPNDDPSRVATEVDAE